MRVLLLAQFYPPIIGGEEQHVKTLAQVLAGRGHSVSVATLRHGETPERSVENGVTVHRLTGTLQRFPKIFAADGRQHAPPFADPEITLALRRLVAEERPHVVHAHNWLIHSYLPLAGGNGPATVVTLHDYSLVCAKKSMIRDGAPCPGSGLGACLKCASTHYGVLKGSLTAAATRLARRMALARVDKFIAVSEAVASRSGLTEGGYDAEVIPNFIPDGLGSTCQAAGHEAQLAQLPKEGYILFVGDLMRLKGIDVLLAAYGKLRNAPPLVMIGRPCSETPQTLPRNVLMFQRWPHGAVIEAWRRCTFGVLPSTGLEACATVVMEANALGRPMIVTRVGGLPEIVDDGQSGLLVAPGDVGDLAAAMQRLIDDHELRERMSAASVTKATTLMASVIVPRIEAAYGSVLARKSAQLTDPAGFSHSRASRA